MTKQNLEPSKQPNQKPVKKHDSYSVSMILTDRFREDPIKFRKITVRSIAKEFNIAKGTAQRAVHLHKTMIGIDFNLDLKHGIKAIYESMTENSLKRYKTLLKDGDNDELMKAEQHITGLHKVWLELMAGIGVIPIDTRTEKSLAGDVTKFIELKEPKKEMTTDEAFNKVTEILKTEHESDLPQKISKFLNRLDPYVKKEVLALINKHSTDLMRVQYTGGIVQPDKEVINLINNRRSYKFENQKDEFLNSVKLCIQDPYKEFVHEETGNVQSRDLVQKEFAEFINDSLKDFSDWGYRSVVIHELLRMSDFFSLDADENVRVSLPGSDADESKTVDATPVQECSNTVEQEREPVQESPNDEEVVSADDVELYKKMEASLK